MVHYLTYLYQIWYSHNTKNIILNSKKLIMAGETQNNDTYKRIKEQSDKFDKTLESIHTQKKAFHERTRKSREDLIISMEGTIKKIEE